MPRSGKRSMIGIPWGPCNEPNINGNHPAMLAGLRCNGDVQLPYRFPITAATHSARACTAACDQKMPIYQLVREAQITQQAQAGYATDYMNKRLTIAIHEIKEWLKAQASLVEERGRKAGQEADDRLLWSRSLPRSSGEHQSYLACRTERPNFSRNHQDSAGYRDCVGLPPAIALEGCCRRALANGTSAETNGHAGAFPPQAH